MGIASVISAMADLQRQIEELDAEISDAEDDAANTSIYAGVTGRVKAIFGEAEAAIEDPHNNKKVSHLLGAKLFSFFYFSVSSSLNRILALIPSADPAL